jgi:hypothetical protein
MPGGQFCSTSAQCAVLNPGPPVFGAPLSSYCGCPTGAGLSPTNNTGFLGWGSDPSVAPITDPSLNPDGRRVVATNIATSAGNIAGSAARDDVIVALSQDGGQTFSHVEYVSTSTTGTKADMPFVFSNPNPPWDTYVSWQSNYGGVTTGYIRKIAYGVSPITFTPGPTIAIPKAPNDFMQGPNRFNFGFGTFLKVAPRARKAFFSSTRIMLRGAVAVAPRSHLAAKAYVPHHNNTPARPALGHTGILLFTIRARPCGWATGPS